LLCLLFSGIGQSRSFIIERQGRKIEATDRRYGHSYPRLSLFGGRGRPTSVSGCTFPTLIIIQCSSWSFIVGYSPHTITLRSRPALYASTPSRATLGLLSAPIPALAI